ncbi:Arginine utilization regulatory protein RocR [Bacillus paralicheniformis]|jgi:arginine utilization regulatory protein|uniref:Arginine utilization regulatory protein RocR n=2 Tax=Bacillus subtilis group TaxID=653685 RepID=A0ABY3FZP0_9BACI|nr:transcriptional regulator RocR [Bacillus paralicheniformis ATCC 9945a]TWJ71307.1 Arginine utilization regulatory protein RocR [Bacillus paralicheniformis]TWJ82303.1 Arginine utilization regulatory protein RocR [Bacillus paralicheniformis]TWK42076.1 Arginine utilization regulatory protein RocR [Bacillus paralicheniformis]TWK89921.1 Arginine utilization regulatory protein RocR [Bacillus paralicheniformis]
MHIFLHPYQIFTYNGETVTNKGGCHLLKNYDLLKLIFQRIIDEIDIGLHVVDENGTSVVYNKKMSQIEGMDVNDVLGKNVLDVFTFASQYDSTLLQALHHGKTNKNVKQTYFNNKGQEITTVNHTFPIMENGNTKGAVEIAKDVTKLERLIRENMNKTENTKYTFDSLIGVSPAFKEVIEHAKRATRTSSSILIVGDTGTGKELFAQSIHNGSQRSTGPFISQNCAALPESLVEGLLFGTAKGAFTGAVDRPGLFEQADGGTLLLDEINSLDFSLQAKLLRAIQEKTIRRIGASKDTPIDVRIIATMNEDPVDAVSGQRLRKDLYYRLSVVTLFIPPLKDRKEDIMPLTQHFIDKYNALFQMEVKGFEEEVQRFLLSYDWPGNVRELEHLIEGAMNLMSYEDKLELTHLPLQYRTKPAAKKQLPQQGYDLFAPLPSVSAAPLKEQIENAEKYYIQKTVKKCNYNVSQAARVLGISRQSLQYRLKKWKIRFDQESE